MVFLFFIQIITVGNNYFNNGTKEESTKEKVFRLLKNNDEREHWLKIIPRDNIPISQHSYMNDIGLLEYLTKRVYDKESPVHPFFSRFYLYETYIGSYVYCPCHGLLKYMYLSRPCPCP